MNSVMNTLFLSLSYWVKSMWVSYFENRSHIKW